MCVVATIIWDTVAIRLGIWGFLKENTSWWILGIPLEEYIFGLWLPIVILGIYTSLPKFKKHSIKEPHLKEIPLLFLIFILQFFVLIYLLYNPVSYLGWLLLLAIIPSLFYLWRRGEKIDEVRLLVTCICVTAIVIAVDNVFVPLGAWHYNDNALLGNIGYIYFDDILFGIFNSIIVVGFYTSLPSEHIFKGKW
jgi:lycopene cyclase domain-containing protein